MKLSGLVHVFGDNVDTDVILPTHAIVNTDPAVLARHCFSGLVEDFAHGVKPGDFIVAGENFGCGSSREHAPLAIKASGIACVVAASFSRIFYRNAINLGLVVIECAQARHHATPGMQATADLEAGVLKIGAEAFPISQYPPQVREILHDGGLVPYMAKRLEKQDHHDAQERSVRALRDGIAE